MLHPPGVLPEQHVRRLSPYVFAGVKGGRSTCTTSVVASGAPAIDAAGVARPARIYDLRSTFASNALAAGITTFELARIMGTSVGMIEAHYGTLIDTAHDGILARLKAHG